MSDERLDTRDAWAVAFTRRLMHLQPTLDFGEAVRICQEIFAVASSTPPDTAAEIYHEACPSQPVQELLRA
jgi:hypothetical protein